MSEGNTTGGPTVLPVTPGSAVDSPRPDAGKTHRGFAYILMLASCVFLSWGGWRMYTYDDSYGSSDHVVGGDAYNYLIHATRGVGLIGVGIASAVLACMLAVLGHSASHRSQ